MAADPDDDALSWGDETDSSHVEGPVTQRQAPAPEPAPSTAPAAAPVATAPVTSSFLLVSYGILAGVYLLYTAGWLVSVLRNTVVFSDVLGEVMFQLGEVLAIAAAPVWFAAVLLLTRKRKPIIRLVWLLFGILILVPVPFLLGV